MGVEGKKRLAKYYSPPAGSRRKTKWLPVSNKLTLKQIKLLFGPLVIQLVWYILKQLFTSVSVKVADIYRAELRTVFSLLNVQDESIKSLLRKQQKGI